MFAFLKSKTFWLAVAHVATVGLGSFVSYHSGTPLPLVVSSGVNALLASPLNTPTPTQNPQ
jgi:hypothetical protein